MEGGLLDTDEIVRGVGKVSMELWGLGVKFRHASVVCFAWFWKGENAKNDVLLR